VKPDEPGEVGPFLEEKTTIPAIVDIDVFSTDEEI